MIRRLKNRIMEIKGSQKELKELFKEKKKQTWFKLPKLKKKLKPEVKKKLLWISFSFGILMVILLSIMFYYQVSSNHLTNAECNILRTDDVRFFLSMQEENPMRAFVYTFHKPIMLMLVAIGISWVLHGVGFRFF